MKPLVESHGMEIKESQSTITDVSKLFDRGVGVSVVNIASGYWFPHTNTEVVNIVEAESSLDLLFEMIKSYGEKHYPHQQTHEGDILEKSSTEKARLFLPQRIIIIWIYWRRLEKRGYSDGGNWRNGKLCGG